MVPRGSRAVLPAGSDERHHPAQASGTTYIDLGLQDAATRPALNASARWLAARGLSSPGTARWRVTVVLDIIDPRVARTAAEIDTRLHVMIDSREWSVFFCHGSGSSWIRVANLPHIHERDDFGLLPRVTELHDLGELVLWIERRFHLRFRRQHAAIHTNLADAHQKLLLWIVAAL